MSKIIGHTVNDCAGGAVKADMGLRADLPFRSVAILGAGIAGMVATLLFFLATGGPAILMLFLLRSDAVRRTLVR